MSHVFFTRELEGVATYWRIYRKDGTALGFTSHDRDLQFGGLRHRAAPGMTPSAIRRGAGLRDDSVDIEGVIAHDSISFADLRSGRFDRARVEVGVVDWETLDAHALYSGTIGHLREDGGAFSAQLSSAKAALDRDFIPRTSPTCRAPFCGPGCNLSSARFTRVARLSSIDPEEGRCDFGIADHGRYTFGEVTWLDGPAAGTRMQVADADPDALFLDMALGEMPAPGDRARLRDGCDHTIATCASRFGNAVNFQGEPFVPGNDLLTRYPQPQ